MGETAVRTLGDVATWYSGGTPKVGTQSYYGGGIPWAVIADLGDGTVTNTAMSITEEGLAAIGGRVAPVDAVLVSMYGTIGRVGLVGRPMATNQAIAWGVVDRTAVLPQFLMIWLQHSRESLDALGRGATQRNINREIIRAFPVPLPPLTEQRRIVDLIGAVDDAQKQAQKALASAGLAQRTVLLDLFSRESVKHVPLVEVLADLIGGVWGSPPGEDEIDVAALGLTAFNAPTARVDRKHTTPRSVNRERWSRRGLRADDIVLERSGGTNDRPVGRVIVAPSDMKDVIPTDFMRLLRVNPSRAVPRYVFWWLWARYQRGDTLAFQSMTTNLRNLRVSDYVGLPMPVPTRDAQCHVAAAAADLASP